MMSYGWPQTGAYSQTDLEFLPKDKPVYDPLVMDYPLHARSPLVGQPARGGLEPTVGCLVDFRENPDSGVAGMALGVEGRTFVKVLIEQRKRLIVDGTDLGAAKRSLEFTDAFRAATDKTFEIGLTMKIARDALEVTAKVGGEMMSVSLPLSTEIRLRLLSRPLAVLSRDGKHWVTPYVDDARRLDPEWGTSTPANRWRFGLEPELYALYRAAWRLGKAAPSSLLGLEKRLIGAASGDRAAQDQAKAAYPEELRKVVADVRRCGAGSGAIKQAIEELGAS